MGVLSLLIAILVCIYIYILCISYIIFYLVYISFMIFILSATRIPPGQISELRGGELKITNNCDTFMMHVC